ncbi:hypothetical protein [Celeribacter marinus]|uniref:hypothetical protein n=1 Tax=Celeribacter marinus TaxID=1397108 RepID=UPI003F6AB97A
MGSGSGGTPTYTSAVSGQTGGRVMPGVSRMGTGAGLLDMVTGDVTAAANATPLYIDRRYHTQALALNEHFGGWGGGPGEAGANGGGYTTLSAQSQDLIRIYQTTSDPAGGYHDVESPGGGGWGAKGGDTLEDAVITATGGAGGKAIQTGGHAVTWLSGSHRAYGAVG